EAIAVYRDVLDRTPADAVGSVGLRNNLAVVLTEKGDSEGALQLLQENVRLWPNQVTTYLNLGNGFLELGRFTEALESFRRAQQLATQTGSRERGQAEQKVRFAERLIELGRRLQAGKPESANATESIEFFVACYLKKRYADAVGFYRRALAQEPKLAATLRRDKAARAAALAAAGRGEATPPLDARRRAELRKQALTWLREDLDAWRRRAKDPKARPTVEADLRFWQRHPNFASLRDPAAV